MVRIHVGEPNILAVNLPSGFAWRQRFSLRRYPKHFKDTYLVRSLSLELSRCRRCEFRTACIPCLARGFGPGQIHLPSCRTFLSAAKLMLDDVTPKSQLRKRSTRENLVACCYPATTEKVTRLSHRRECNSRDRRGSSAFTSGISC